MAKSFRDTANLFASQLILVIDRDEPNKDEYYRVPKHELLAQHSSGPLWPPDPIHIIEVDGGSMAKATNEAAALIWDDDIIIGHVGDDHRFRTQAWDARVAEVLADKPGIAYGDDGYWGRRLPTAVFMNSIIPRTLGWLALPSSNHYGIDDAWGDLGRGIDSLHYLPDVKIIQPGPFDTAATGDEIFWRAQIARKKDVEAYYEWRNGESRLADLDKLRKGLGLEVPA
jgi:hypothetical protein